MTMTPEQLKRIRGRLKMTQVKLAEALGVRRVTVARWEIGNRGIPEPTARLIRFIGMVAGRVAASRIERAETKLFLQLWRASARGGKGKKRRDT